MPLPAGLNLVTVGGSVIGSTGIPATGTVEFALPAPLRDGNDEVILGTALIVGSIVDGALLPMHVPANDTVGVSPAGWAYTVTVRTDQLFFTFSAVVPSSPATTTLDQLVQVADPPVPQVYVPLQALGVSVATLVGGKVPTSQLPASSGGGVATVTAADGTIAVTGTAANPIVGVGTVPKANLSAGVQTSLSLADTAVQSAPVTSVAGRTGVVVLAKSDVGLSNVDNTSDANKPISTAVGGALTSPRTTLPLSFWDGAVAATYDPSNTNQSSAGNSQQGAVLWLPGPHTYTSIWTYVKTAGAHGAGSADVNGFRVWNAAGSAVLSSTTPGSPTTLWETTGKVALALDTPIVVDANGLLVKAELSTHGYDTPPAMHYQVMAASSALSAVGGSNGPRSWGAFRSSWPAGAITSTIDGGGYVPLILLS